MSDGRKRTFRWMLSLLLSAGALALFFSCQADRRQAQSSGSSPSISSATPASAVESPTFGAPTTQQWKASGFRYPPARENRDSEDVKAENTSCILCHEQSDSTEMHARSNHGISCIDCHGGERGNKGFDLARIAKLPRTDATFVKAKQACHVQPRLANLWSDPREGLQSSANPVTPGAATLREDVNFIRFVNPGDLRSARMACGACHNKASDPTVDHVEKSMMTHGSMLWEAALYNNGTINRKSAVYGESYSSEGIPRQILPASRPSATQASAQGWLAGLLPLPRWEVSQPGNILRVFENGGKRRPILGLPDSEDEPGRPDVKLSVRGLGTDLRTDPVFIGLQKTRLLDPTLNLFGTNDHPGDFRASGCSACHVVYGNDRSSVHSDKWSNYGNRGESFSADRNVNPSGTTQPYNTDALFSTTRPSRESGHPIRHQFEKAMPTSTCIVCHVHPGTNVLNSYLGYIWWDNETDGRFMYPKLQKYPTTDDEATVSQHNPEQTAARGLWSNLYPNDLSQAGLRAGKDFLENLTNLNPLLEHSQFADFHGHGWIFRAVFKQDRHGNLLNPAGEPVVASATLGKSLGEGVSFHTEPTSLKADKADFTDEENLTRAKKSLLATQIKSPPEASPVHLKDIHLEKGMQCVDCHFSQDSHGDGNLYGETRNAIMVDCIDCHGTAAAPARLLTVLAKEKESPKPKDIDAWVAKSFTGNAAANPTAGQIVARRGLIKNRFIAVDVPEGEVPVLYQKSAIDPNKGWYVKQVAATVRQTPPSIFASENKAEQEHARAARYAHTIRKTPKTGKVSYGLTEDEDKQLAEGKLTEDSLCLAHPSSMVACYTCHTSWNTSCFGCHLPMRANQKKPMLHNEGIETRNYTNYNYQTLRDDIFMMGVDSTVKQHKVVPIRSACAVLVSSQDANRQWSYTQQQTISAEGFAGTSFSPYFPHTVRSRETRQCSDCHLSAAKDNNAIMAQTLLQGTNAVNFMGRFAYVAEEGEGLQAVAVTERDEPQAVIGSTLHNLAYPDWFKAHQNRGLKLTEAHEHAGTVYDLQLRGEYLYAACGSDGFIAYDVANIDNKGFSERIVTAPVSPLGQRLFVRTKFATSVCSPSTLAIDPTRDHLKENEEGRAHLLYAFLYVTDREEGLVVIGNQPGTRAARENNVGVATLLDGDPNNNFLERALTYNPSGLLTGARSMTLNGHYAYISSNAGIVVVDLDDPLHPRVTKVLGAGVLNKPRKVAVQFRYAFVCDADGLKVLDATDPSNPKLVPEAMLKIPDARDIYLCRTFGYVAAGRDGLIIVDLESPEALRPEPINPAPLNFSELRLPAERRTRKAMAFTSNGKINDATAVRVGMTNNSLFAYIADGRNGLRVLQLTSDATPGFQGFSPLPVPKLIAEFPTRGPAIALSKGLDRDRAVDESGHQLSVFGRKGARPFNADEQRRLYLTNPLDPGSNTWVTHDKPTADSVDLSTVKPGKQ